MNAGSTVCARPSARAATCFARALAAAAATVALVACAEPPVTVAPVYELPVDDPDALPTGLDRVTLAVATAGDEQDLVAVSFAPGEQVALEGVPFGDDLVIHLTGFVGGGDVAYGRTCRFEVAPGAPVPSPHLLFARNVKFATIAAAGRARTGGLAITDHDGHAIIVGGDDAASAAAVEHFDPRDGSLVTVAPVVERTRAVAAPLGLGDAERVVIAGGLDDDLPATAIEVLTLEPAPRVERLDDARLARTAFTMTPLTDGRVVAIGGRLALDEISDAIVELSPSGALVELRTPPARLAHARADHTATRLGDDVGADVLIAGGRDAAGTIAVAELWKPLAGELADPARFAPAMVVPRHRHVAQRLPDGSVLFIGGLDAAGAPVRTLERFSLDAGFEPAGELPPTAATIDFTATPLPDGRVLLAGGRAAPGGPALDTAIIARLDVLSGAVDILPTDRLAVPRARHQAALLCDGTVLVTGGAPDATRAERYNPPLLGRR